MKAILRLAAASLLLTGSAFALSGERMPEMTLDQMTPAQRSIAEAIIHGPRGRMRGPFNTWLRSPELADRLQKVGRICPLQHLARQTRQRDGDPDDRAGVGRAI